VLGAWLRLPLRDDAPCVALPCACGPGAHKQPSSDTEKDVACCLAHSRTGQRLALARMVPSGAAQQAAVIRSLCMQLPRHGDSMQTAARSTFTLIRSLGGLEAGDCLAVGAAALLLWLLPVEAGRRGAMGVAVHSSKTAPACMHAYRIIDIHTYGMRVCDHRATLCNALQRSISATVCVTSHRVGGAERGFGRAYGASLPSKMQPWIPPQLWMAPSHRAGCSARASSPWRGSHLFKSQPASQPASQDTSCDGDGRTRRSDTVRGNTGRRYGSTPRSTSEAAAHCGG
jgi:hypothetical protein